MKKKSNKELLAHRDNLIARSKSFNTETIEMTKDDFNSWLDDDKEEFKGGLLDGERHGYGVLKWPDGKQYIGDWRHGNRHGHGIVLWPDGQQYVGEWVDDLATGKAILSKPDGSIYVGEFKDSIRHGIGTQAYPNGASYTGGWNDNEPDGWGVIRTLDGNQLIGKFEINQRHGQGVQFYKDGINDDNNRQYWEEGELISQPEWFTRLNKNNFILATNNTQIPFDDSVDLPREEKIFILLELNDDWIFDCEKIEELSMRSAIYMHKLDTFNSNLFANIEWKSILLKSSNEIEIYCNENNLSKAIYTRLIKWCEWSKSDEKIIIENHFKLSLKNLL